MVELSVVMSVYNEEKYLQDSLKSVLMNTFRDFEFIVIDDGSSDKSSEILRIACEQESRLKLFTNPKNLGIAKSTNFALSKCVGKYIAIMDADDISLETRFQTQLDYLCANPEVDLVGASIFNLLGQDDRLLSGIKEAPTKNLNDLLLKENVIMNPTVMFRRNLYDLGLIVHNAKYRLTHDYELWTRLALNKNLANIAEPLVCYRLEKTPENSASSRAPFRREVELIILRTKYLYNLLLLKKFKFIHVRYYFAAIYRQSIPSFLRIAHSVGRKFFKTSIRALALREKIGNLIK